MKQINWPRYFSRSSWCPVHLMIKTKKNVKSEAILLRKWFKSHPNRVDVIKEDSHSDFVMQWATDLVFNLIRRFFCCPMERFRVVCPNHWAYVEGELRMQLRRHPAVAVDLNLFFFKFPFPFFKIYLGLLDRHHNCFFFFFFIWRWLVVLLSATGSTWIK